MWRAPSSTLCVTVVNAVWIQPITTPTPSRHTHTRTEVYNHSMERWEKKQPVMGFSSRLYIKHRATHRVLDCQQEKIVPLTAPFLLPLLRPSVYLFIHPSICPSNHPSFFLPLLCDWNTCSWTSLLILWHGLPEGRRWSARYLRNEAYLKHYFTFVHTTYSSVSDATHTHYITAYTTNEIIHFSSITELSVQWLMLGSNCTTFKV